MNAQINSFIEHKKLKFGSNKCSKIHIGSKCDQCPELFVHEETMKESQKEKYLGDYVNEQGTLKDTLVDRRNKGYAIVSQILAMLKELPLYNLRIEIGLALRQAWLINGMLYNSEVWHG